MEPREDAAHNFSSFAKFSADHFSHWQTEPALLRSMKDGIAKADQVLSLDEWALYWHKHWHKHREDNSPLLAEHHLAAHLQEPCLRVAQKMQGRVYSSAKVYYGLNDCFNIAFLQLKTVLAKFRMEEGTSLSSFAFIVFRSSLFNDLRKQKALDISTDWQFLRRLNPTKLKEILYHRGLTEVMISQYRLAWTCFDRVYADNHIVPGQQSNKRNPAPSKATWQEITNLYNQGRFSQPTGEVQVQTSETIQQWLDNVVVWGRTYLTPPQSSLDTSSTGDDSGKVIGNLASGLDKSLFESWVDQEMGGQINGALQNALQGLKPEARELLRLYYKEQWTQQAIGKEMKIDQYKVCRRLGKARKELLAALAKWCQEQWQVKLEKDTIAGMSKTLEDWLSR